MRKEKRRKRNRGGIKVSSFQVKMLTEQEETLLNNRDVNFRKSFQAYPYISRFELKKSKTGEKFSFSSCSMDSVTLSRI